ncbi:two-component system, cell cycle sensor histidine kinase and response regulator CckA [Pseudooceanicola antarcticus]|uniref:histidine kinase n=1 Tax=Pseudooceanicola antarcticus TaxID=1247613 RepID=A0A285IVR4_9RHOB|nr:two-component system, cell cycle sensor histidine kinase and response regulator CckA [Pseudooceanicola antarcticus]
MEGGLAQAGTEQGQLDLARRGTGPRGQAVLVLAFFFVASAALIPDTMLSLVLLLSGLSLGALVLLLRRAGQAPARADAPAEVSDLPTLLEGDAAPCLIAGGEGELVFINRAARAMFSGETPETLEAALSCRVNAAEAVVRRLTVALQRDGSASEDLVTPTGHMRLSVQRLEAGQSLWRIEELGRTAEDAEAGQLPVLTVGRGEAILYMNAAARQLAGGRPRRLSDLVIEGPEGAERRVLIRTADGTEDRRMTEISRAAGRREILLLPMDAEITEAAREEAGTIWSMVDALPVPILRLSVEGKIELANAAACHLLSIPARPEAELGDLMEGLGRSIREWLAEAASQPVESPSKPRSEFLRLSRSEIEVFVQVAVKPMPFDGRVALIAVLSDATELKTLEAQFVQSQKMQAIGQLAGGVAHDFNNLLTAITGHCDLLLLRHDQGDPDYGDLIQINQNANRAGALVGQLLAFSRKQTLRPEPLDLRDTLSDLTHLLNRLVGEKVTLSLSHDPVLPQIRADKRQLEQVLMNLVVNARDAMPEGGEIRVTTEVLHLEEEMHRDRAMVAPGDYVSVRVDDTGCGIPPDKLPKVFEPFFTTKRVGEGTGLGLSTAYGIIKQSGGFIFVDSTPGQGTCFTLLFPARAAEAEPEPEVLPPQTDEPTTARGDGVVLLVEDEAPVRAFASRALRLRGYTVLEAENAEDALEVLDSTTQRIDVFVTDVIMPGMDGPSWVREALKTHPDTRVVFVSGYAEDSFAEFADKIPNSIFLPKPFSLAELTETVRRQMV